MLQIYLYAQGQADLLTYLAGQLDHAHIGKTVLSLLCDWLIFEQKATEQLQQRK